MTIPIDPVVISAFVLALVRAVGVAVHLAAVQHPDDPHPGEGRRRRRTRARRGAAHLEPGAAERHRRVHRVAARAGARRVHARHVHDAAAERVAGRRASSSTSSRASRCRRSTTRSTTRRPRCSAASTSCSRSRCCSRRNAYLILVNGFFRSFEVVPAGDLSMSTIVVGAHEEPRPVPDRRASRSRVRSSRACSSPRSASGCSRAPRRTSTCSRSRSRCAS